MCYSTYSSCCLYGRQFGTKYIGLISVIALHARCNVTMYFFSKTLGDLGPTPEMFFAQWYGMVCNVMRETKITFKTKNFATQSIVHITPTNYLFISPPLSNNAYPRPRLPEPGPDKMP